MKNSIIITLLCVFCFTSSFAQKFDFNNHKKSVDETIVKLIDKHEQDSIFIVESKNAELVKLKENLYKDINNQQALYTKTLLMEMSIFDTLPNINEFIKSFIGKADNPVVYFSLTEDMHQIANQLSKYELSGAEILKTFIDDVIVLEKAVGVLENLAEKDVVDGIRTSLSNAKFSTAKQQENVKPVLSALKNYAEAKYHMKIILRNTKNICDDYKKHKDLNKATLDFEDDLYDKRRLEFINSVPCVKDVYNVFIEKVIARKGAKEYDFEKFNINLLDNLYSKLEK